jgi:hypothetical protein
VEKPQPLEELLRYQRRFRGVDKGTIENLKKSIEEFNRIIDRMEMAFKEESPS